jgi:hypothetical protein
MIHALTLSRAKHAPALIAASGERTSYRFFEFFTANIRNPNTRRVYAHAAERRRYHSDFGTSSASNASRTEPRSPMN